MAEFDAVAIGLNATDRLILVPRYPACGGKIRYREEYISPGGEAATAMVAAAALGLRSSYIGAVGDDEFGRIQVESLRQSGVCMDHLLYRRNCPNQSACIIIDQSTGERTVFAHRPEALAIEPGEIPAGHIRSARLLHLDGHNTEAAAWAASVAREAGIPVTMDVDTVYPGFEKVLPNVDYLLASAEFPLAWTGLADPFEALAAIQEQYGMRVAGMTLGRDGALARAGGRFVYSPGYVVQCVDTTGAGDVFHGAFCYAALQGWPLREALEFSNAMAALNCTALGARAGIRALAEVRDLQAHGARRVAAEYADRGG